MKKIAILIVTTMSLTVGVVAQMLPGDGATVTVYGIDAEIAESADGLCDLSAAAVTGETEMRFEYYGDSLVRRIAGRQADWLRISNDSIWSLGADTRRANTRYNRGLPYLLPSLNAETGDFLTRQAASGTNVRRHRPSPPHTSPQASTSSTSQPPPPPKQSNSPSTNLQSTIPYAAQASNRGTCMWLSLFSRDVALWICG